MPHILSYFLPHSPMVHRVQQQAHSAQITPPPAAVFLLNEVHICSTHYGALLCALALFSWTL